MFAPDRKMSSISYRLGLDLACRRQRSGWHLVAAGPLHEVVFSGLTLAKGIDGMIVTRVSIEIPYG
jgi:hypothetical protein